jgi:hypothetical protein
MSSLAKEKEKAKIRMPAAWHSPVKQYREGSRTMPMSQRQTTDKEKNSSARKMRDSAEEVGRRNL